MNRIIYLDGSRAVGKTTLLKKIKEEHPDYVIVDGFARKEFSFNMFDFNEFLINEKIYLACDAAQYKIYRSIDSTVIVVKGPITDLLFAKHFSKLYFNNLDLYTTELKDYLLDVEKCTADKTIYLSAKKETILKRYAKDHFRATMDEFMNNWYSYFDDYFQNDKNTTVIDTENLDANEVYKRFMEIIDGE